MKRLLIKTVSLLLLLAFSANTCCYGLATLPASQNPLVKREIEAALQRTQIRYAESDDAIRLLNANNASCLLLSSGKYLVTKEVAENDLKLLRAIIHEDIEAIMQIIAKEDRYKYQGIKELILKYFPPSKDNKLPIDLYVNHIVARAFEWLSLLEDRMIVKDEIPPQEIAFINIIKPMIMANKHSYFTSEFWDSNVRGKRIKNAFNNGMVFYKVANTSVPTDSPMSIGAGVSFKKSGIIFDMDGTLYSNEALNKAYRDKILFGVLPKLKGWGYEEAKRLYEETEVKLKAQRSRIGVKEIFENFGVDWKIALLTMDELAQLVEPKEYLSRNSQLVERFRVLSSTHKIAVLSNNGRVLVEKTLGALGIRDFVSVIVSRTELGENLKPNPRAFEMVIDKLDLNKEDVIVIGDDVEKDIKPAEAIGIKAICIGEARDLYRVIDDLVLSKSLKLLTEACADNNIALPVRDAIIRLSKDKLSVEEADAINLAIRLAVAFSRGEVTKGYFNTIIRGILNRNSPLVTKDINGKDLFDLLKLGENGVGLGIPNENGVFRTDHNLTQDDLEASIRYLRMARVLLENTSRSKLMQFMPSRVTEISPSKVGNFSGSAVLAVNDEQGLMHVFVDPQNSARINIRQVPDLNPEGMSNPLFERATEIVPLRAYKSKEVNLKKFRGWDLLPDDLKNALSDLFSRNLVPITLKSGDEIDFLSVALETSRQNDVAPGRTGPLLYKNGFVIVKDANGRELLLDIKGVGAFDGTFVLRKRTIYRGSIGGKRLTTQITVGRGYLAKSNADADTEHLQALENEPTALASIQSVPVFQVDFDLEGQKFSLEARLSPGNRRMGQYWKTTELLEQEKFNNAKILGKSVAGMLLEHRPVVHRAFNLENFFDPLSAFASYGNPGSVTYLDTQRRAFIFMQRWLIMAEERVTHKWGHEKDPADIELAQQFWDGFIDLFLEVVDFSDDIKQQLIELRATTYSEKKKQKILSLVWDNYLVQRIFEARLHNGYQPVSFLQPTYSGEADILPPMQTDSEWASEELALYDVLLNSEYGKRHAEQIKVQRDQLVAVAKERYPKETIKLIRSELTAEFEKVLKSDLNEEKRTETEQIRDKFLTLLNQLEIAVQKSEISLQANARLDVNGKQILTEGLPKSSGREERFGVLAITGDPIHWGHLYSALSSILLYKFDKVIILGPGKKDHKPGMPHRIHRQKMIEKAVSILSPFLVYSPIGKDDYRLGEEHFIDLVSLNSDKSAVFYYLRGEGSKNKMIQILGNLIDINKDSLEKANNIRIGVAFIDRNVPDEEIVVSDPRIEVLNKRPESQLNISSTRVKGTQGLFLVPEVVRNYILENGLYSRSQPKPGFLNLSNATIGITGATGDIGHSFINMVRNRGGNVLALVRPESLERAAALMGEGEENLSYVDGDLLDRDALVRLVQSTDVVYHLGAVVGQNLSDRKENVFAINAISTALLTNVINSQNPNKRIVYASSQRIYAIREREDVNAFLRIAYGRVRAFVVNTEGLSTGEIQEKALALSKELVSQIPQDVNIYDVTKLLGEMFVADLPNHVIARVSNAYGPDYQNPRLINRLINAIVDGRSVTEANETRDFIYQDDLNQVLLALANGEALPREIDVASGLPVSMGRVKDALTKMVPHAGSLLNIAGDVLPAANQNSTYAEKLLGRKFTDIETGLRNVVDSYGLLNNPVKKVDKDVIVMDVGGTFTRVAVFGKDGQIKYQKKIDSPNFMRVSGGIAELQNAFIRATKDLILVLREEHPEINTDSLSIAFPGPVNDQGVITGAATLWGKNGEGIKYDIAKALRENIPGLKNVFVLNDNSAAMLRYAQEKKQKNISVVTISSGISHKIYLRDQGGLLMDSDGLTGEIGHLRVDFSNDALICDCGGRGHLGAVASGRGVEHMAQKMATGQYKQMYTNSILYKLSNGDAKAIKNDMLVEAVHKDDTFALMVLDQTTAYLADVLAHIAVAASIEKFVIVGGFAQAIGQQYIESLNKRLGQHDFYGRDIEFGNALVELGQDDGLDNLLGMGYFAREKMGTNNVERIYEQKPDDIIESRVSFDKKISNYFTKRVFGHDNHLLASLAQGRQIIVFVDKRVAQNFGDEIARYFESHRQYFINYKIHIVDGDETSKTVETALDMVNKATVDGANRRAIFLAIGGGAIMDTVGFAAQLYMRGVDYIRIPTTLLGIVDAAVGIKVGVNYNNHKNFIGAFYPPMAVVSDIRLIQSLDARQLRGGVAEILKVAIISNKPLFEKIEKIGADLVNPNKLQQDPYKFEDILKEAALELVRQLEADFYERDLMRHVDFGHTMAHYFESVSNYEITHGEAVAIDILISAYIAKNRGILSPKDFDRIVALHKKLGLPFYHPKISTETMWNGVQEAISHKGGHLMMVVPKKIGQTVFIDSLSKEELSGAFEFLKFFDEETIADTNLSRGRIDELRETHPAVDAAANEGRMFAITLDQVDKLQQVGNEVLVDLLISNLVHLRSPPTTRQKLLRYLQDAAFREKLSKGFTLMSNSIKDKPLPQDKPIRLCIVIEGKNLPTIVFKDPYNNLIAHSGKGEKTSTSYTSIYAGYNSLAVALKTNREDDFKKIINHEADDIARGYHLNEKIAEAAVLYDNVLDLYDAHSATVLLTDLLYTQLHEDRSYEIKYDTSRLTTSQIEIIEEYARLLQLRSSNPDNIKLRPFSSAQGSKESLIAVYCTGKDFKGEGHVDVAIPDGELKEYLLRIAGMVNIALASSNIPDNLSREEVDKYRPIMSYIKNQYKAILGEELVIPDSPEDILKVIRRIVLGLPKSLRMNTDQIEEFNRLAKAALTAA